MSWRKYNYTYLALYPIFHMYVPFQDNFMTADRVWIFYQEFKKIPRFSFLITDVYKIITTFLSRYLCHYYIKAIRLLGCHLSTRWLLPPNDMLLYAQHFYMICLKISHKRIHVLKAIFYANWKRQNKKAYQKCADLNLS